MITIKSSVEIRTPTYKRPWLLLRALTSLLNQTHSDWYCRVLDDSRNQEGRAVCELLADRRIIYEPNSENLGICKNLGNPPLFNGDRK